MNIQFFVTVIIASVVIFIVDCFDLRILILIF